MINKIVDYFSKVKKSSNEYISKEYIINSKILTENYNWPLDFAIHTVVPNGILGDYWEFGVFQGRSFIRAYNTFKSLNSLNRKFVAFDSFQGLPESKEPFKPNQYEKGAFSCPENEFKSNLEIAGLNKNKIEVISGFYEESLKSEITLSKLKNSKIAVVYIDCDIYESAREVFNFITNYLQDGSIIVMDDWFRHLGIPQYGIQKAFYNWIEDCGWKYVELAKSKKVAFIVYK